MIQLSLPEIDTQDLHYYREWAKLIHQLPVAYYHGWKLRREIPDLPDAKEPSGVCNPNGSKRLRLLGIGESTISGVGVEYHKDGLIGQIAKHLSTSESNLRVDWSVTAHTGYTARNTNEKLVPLLPHTPQDVVIIGLGGNDTFQMTRPSVWSAEIRKLIESVQAKYPHCVIIFGNMPAVRNFPVFTDTLKNVLALQVDYLSSCLVEICASYQCVHFLEEIVVLHEWMDKEGLSDHKPEDFYSDGVHPSALTFDYWGADIARYILNLGLTPIGNSAT